MADFQRQKEKKKKILWAQRWLPWRWTPQNRCWPEDRGRCLAEWSENGTRSQRAWHTQKPREVCSSAQSYSPWWGRSSHLLYPLCHNIESVWHFKHLQQDRWAAAVIRSSSAGQSLVFLDGHRKHKQTGFNPSLSAFTTLHSNPLLFLILE